MARDSLRISLYQNKPLDLGRRKLNRSSHPKVRTGCSTCKARRVKCDETKPACKRCVKRGLPCGGYVPITTLVFNPCEDVNQNRSYQYFHERSFQELTGFYDFFFWQKVIFPSSRYERPIRHALAALGSLHESTNVPDDDPDKRRKLRFFAAEQYNKSICHLTNKMDPPSPEVAMITCIMFMCFETLLGNAEQVAELFKNGLKLVEASRYWDKGSGIIREMIVPVIARWRVQLSTYTIHRSANDKPLPLTLDASKIDILPTPCESLQTFNTIMDHVHAFLSPRVGVEPSDPRLPEMIKRFQTMLSDWSTKFEAFVTTRPPIVQSNLRFQRGVLWLRMNYLVATILVPTLPYQDEMLYDQYQSVFDTILAYAAESLAVERRMYAASPPVAGATAPGKTKHSFGLDLGMVPALTFVAMRCRDHRIRHQAIDLLDLCNRFDGLFSSKHCADKMRKFVALEEKGLTEPRTSADVPLESRYKPYACQCILDSESVFPTIGKTMSPQECEGRRCRYDDYEVKVEDTKAGSLEQNATGDVLAWTF